MKIKNEDNSFRPLETVEISKAGPGSISVFDGEGRQYVESNAENETNFKISGSLGTHIVFYQDEDGQIQDKLSFEVDCETEIKEDTGKYQELLNRLYDTLFQDWTKGYTKFLRIKEKQYKFYVTWLRDHVHALKGMRYWDDDIKSGIELYADSQREDGMIWDKCKQMCHSEKQTWRDIEFEKGDFVRKIPGNPTRRWMRIPIENDVEYLFIEGLYRTWKACGDDQWMENLLDNAIQAVNYSTSDIYRWSEKYQLLKRGYTIDTWDFQSEDDVQKSSTKTVMRVDPETTEFNIFYGDNTGMAQSCRYLAEMLRGAGRNEEAQEYEDLAENLLQRLNDLSWNGNFYTHMVPENSDVKRDLGDTPTEKQVTLSNAYSLNRSIDHEKCVEIIKTYQQIRNEMPDSSPGEWYNCYPPFEKGFNFDKWEYMNGGVSTITAGELARGSFAHGFEEYGVDILQRIFDLSEEFGGYLHICYKGKLPETNGQANFKCIDIDKVANVDLYGDKSEEVTGWAGGKNDLCNLPTGKQNFKGIDFKIIDPSLNNRQAVLGISRKEGYKDEEILEINDKAETVYFLHTASGDLSGWQNSTLYSGLKNPQELVGEITFSYKDGTEKTQYIQNHEQIESYFLPAPDKVNGDKRRSGPYRIAWQGSNRLFENVGVFAYGWSNPYPEKQIEKIKFKSVDRDVKWFIAGITLSDEKVNFPESKLSFGIPDMWGAGALTYSLLEGLAGIIDDKKGFEKAKIRPRWSITESKEVTACAKYPASNGYVRYYFNNDVDNKKIQMWISGNAKTMEADILLPNNTNVKYIKLDNKKTSKYKIKTFEGSKYLKIDLEGIKVHHLEISYAKDDFIEQ